MGDVGEFAHCRYHNAGAQAVAVAYVTFVADFSATDRVIN